jgi:hypothetical protein
VKILPKSTVTLQIDDDGSFTASFVFEILNATHGRKVNELPTRVNDCKFRCCVYTIRPWENTTRPPTIVVFTRPVSVWPDHGELIDLLKPVFAS